MPRLPSVHSRTKNKASSPHLRERTMRHALTLLLPLLLCAALGCGSDADEPADATTTAAFTPGAARPVEGGGPGEPSAPLEATCAAGELRRCRGNVLQDCNPTTHLWEDFQLCATIGDRCSTAPADCAGLVNWGCCVAAAPASPPSSPPPAGDRDCADFTCQGEAQAFFIANGGPALDPHGLDGDGDGIACEDLPTCAP